MFYDYGNGIYGIDAHYEGEGFVEVYLVRSLGEAAIIETAHNRSLPCVLEALGELGVARESVKYVCVTHVHLDHAGGAGSYMREFPNAKLVVHPRGARHMIDPAKLVEGVKEVYGPEETERLYGTIIPVPAERVLAPQDGEELTLGGRRLVCYDAPGHAKHHMIFFEKTTKSVFAGDGFGISYSCMDGTRGRWAIPTASPVQFDPEAMKATIDHIVSLEPETVFLTHFGPLTNIAEIAESLKKSVDKYVEIAVASRGEREGLSRRLTELYRELITENGQASRMEEIERAHRWDLELNIQGLACWYAHEHKK
ncbi:MBL fold metallo-hydrolase [Cloacibacillus sp. An23]|uniref:MBL fold metallo-hydrolase n=1 Tax=Cloacibacillus sp. An23 TaxID=1965591 RepID=UPI000B3A92D6|nr:MBL fold metallo-hydrolase [Cloacibacillus sp. An23]OUO92752.1 hypothetical protein B5F39_09740 [Cloacibacillus sp. An23]